MPMVGAKGAKTKQKQKQKGGKQSQATPHPKSAKRQVKANPNKPRGQAAKARKGPRKPSAAPFSGDKQLEVRAAKREDEEVKEKVEEAEAPEAPVRKTKANRLEKMQARSEADDAEPRGVLYLGHIPPGFFEPQMKKFFSQFGRVLRLRLSRSKRTTQSKGYAFIEFEEESVAKIVAETMDKYLLFGRKLVCELVPKAKQHPALFKNWKHPITNNPFKRQAKVRKLFNDRPTVDVNGEALPQKTLKQVKRRAESNTKLEKLLESLGVDYKLEEAGGGSVQVPKVPGKGKSASSA